MNSMTPEKIREINRRAMRARRGPHVHQPARVRDEDNNVVGAFCACGALFNTKMRPAVTTSLRIKIVKQMERIRDEAQEETEDA